MWTWTLVHSSKNRGQFEQKTETMERFESWLFRIRKNSSITDSGRSYHQTGQGRERDSDGVARTKMARTWCSTGFTGWFITRQRRGNASEPTLKWKRAK